MTRRWRPIAAALLLLVVAGFAYRSFVGGEVPRPLSHRKVTRGDLIASVTATGTVNPVKTVQVGTYVSGPIQAIDVDFNSPVKKDQRVAKIDPRPFELRVQQSEAGLANARAALDEGARRPRATRARTSSRNRKLREQGIVAADAVDVLASSVDQARARSRCRRRRCSRPRRQLEEARVNLGYTDIVSPVDGVVVSRSGRRRPDRRGELPDADALRDRRGPRRRCR